MAAEQRKLLEQLMGGGIARSNSQISLTDPKACRSYIAGNCPHDLFTNTKQDLGPCSKVHSEALKAEYEALSDSEKKKTGFDYDYMRDLAKYIDDCDRRISAAQRRLEKTPEEIRQTNELLKQISDLNESIACGTVEVQILAFQLGDVGRAYDDFFKVKQMQAQKAEKERELKSLYDTSGPSGHQKLQVCDVCGAYLSRLDNDRRLADHFFGKMHLGYAQMRKTYESFPKEMRHQRRPMQMSSVNEEEMGGVPTGPGGGGYGGRGPRGGYHGGRGGRGGRRGGW
ncbi:hypothetical protein QBC37DRAFT_421766 [Rhypophila decipiens]|uniref:Uncharacterized protein n=1 Tax=Rhypophila decipiens TaxID=261697 RepID=A0AAN6Y7K4_9PEZI|nr:hypothetical protein QBC37DRAFT_421766 [Rhypophila decipiens]